MRIPIILMLAVIVFTPDNIGEVARDAFDQAQAIVVDYLDRDRTVEVASAAAEDGVARLVTASSDSARNLVGNIR